jgi:hypothetical protein
MNPTKRTRIEMEPEITTRYKRKAETQEVVCTPTPMEIDTRPPFIFYPIPQLIRCDANALDEDEMEN